MVGRSRPFTPSAVDHPLWSTTLDELSRRLSVADLDALRRDARLLELRSGRLRLGLPSPLRSWVRSGHVAFFDEALARASENGCELCVVPLPSVARPLPLDPTHTLDRFVVSPTNERARRASDEVVARSGRHPTPLLWWGPPASGKTHLLSATAQRFQEVHAESRVVCAHADEFTFQLVAAIRSDEVARFRRLYRECDALFLDALERLGEREASQAELVGVIDRLASRGAPVALTASAEAKRIPGLSDDLSGLIGPECSLQLTAPEWETRLAIVLERLEGWGIPVEEGVAPLLVSRLGSELDRLDGVLTRMFRDPDRADGRVDPDVLLQTLDRPRTDSGRVPPEAVLALVARHFNLRQRDLRSATRSPRITVPRQIAMFLVRRHCGLSYPEIGQRFGRHHTTVLHAFRTVQRQLQESASLRATVRELERELWHGSKGER